jgi:hypothetical protein
MMSSLKSYFGVCGALKLPSGATPLPIRMKAPGRTCIISEKSSPPVVGRSVPLTRSAPTIAVAAASPTRVCSGWLIRALGPRV